MPQFELWIPRADEIQTLWWSRRARFLVALVLEEPSDVFERPTTPTDIHHDPHEKPHHPMEEPIRLDRKDKTLMVAALLPPGGLDDASVMLFDLSDRRKRSKVVLTDQVCGGRIETSTVEGDP